MINEQPVLNFIQIRVQDKITSEWTNIAAETTRLNSTRGGRTNFGGITSVDSGITNIRLKNLYDPSLINFLTPQMKIQVYNTTFATPDEGSIFYGVIDDIDSEYILNKYTGNIDVYVNILTSDAVASHNNTSINGIQTTEGYQRWEERIETVEPKAITEIVIPEVNADIRIYSI